MKSVKPSINAFFIILPILSMTILAAIRYFYPSLDDSTLDTLLWISGILGTLLSVMTLGLFLWTRMQSKELQRRADNIKILHTIAGEQKDENEHLKNQVELLTAMREMALVANDNTLFKETLAKIFSIMESLLDCQSITLYLLDDGAKNLYPRVHFNGTTTTFDDNINRNEIDGQLVQDAFEFKRSFNTVSDGVLFSSSPLLADDEAIGIVEISVRLFGSPEEQSAFIDKYQYRLEAISKHISLPIRKSYLFDEATVDVLTRLYTKRFLLTRMSEAFSVAQKKGKALSLIMCDVDHFKAVNDTHGHPSGDIILRSIAAILLDLVRDSDSCYRYGGEEMVILLLGSSDEKALEISERIRAKIESTKFLGDEGQHIPITISMGCCSFESSLLSAEEMLSLADKALYHSKENGRNRVTLHVHSDPPRYESPSGTIPPK